MAKYDDDELDGLLDDEFDESLDELADDEFASTSHKSYAYDDDDYSFDDDSDDDSYEME